ncbi:MAG: hypothetical protein HQL90_07280 [Magnetococcales bacterium]|nr:hypothetical protein [Magnetococcales bacterium]
MKKKFAKQKRPPGGWPQLTDNNGAAFRTRTEDLLITSYAISAFSCINLTASELFQPFKKPVEIKQNCGYPSIKVVHLISPRVTPKVTPQVTPQNCRGVTSNQGGCSYEIQRQIYSISETQRATL